MNLHSPPILTEQVLSRVCGEYLEMAGLRLTQKQAQRLWGLDEAHVQADSEVPGGGQVPSTERCGLLCSLWRRSPAGSGSAHTCL